MNRLSAFMNSQVPVIKALVITLMALLFSHLVIYDLMSVSFFSPMEKASDFRFSDFYTIVANDRAVHTLDSDIVIVSVDGCNRREIARTINDIDFCAPAAVGLDIAFSAPSNPDDDPLTEALSLCANLVMPVVVTEENGMYSISHVSWYDSVVKPSGGFAAVNIQGAEDARATVREFSAGFAVNNGKIPSLPAALAAIADPKAAVRLTTRANNDEAISYISREFDILTPEEIINNTALLKGKIVLLGKLHDIADTHVTPVDNFTPGLLIHAYTTATILSGNFTRRLTTIENYLIAALLCYLVVWLNIYLKGTPLGSFFVRGIQLLLLYLMIVIGTAAYIHYNVDLNFAYSMLTTSLGVASCDVFDGLFAPKALIDRISNYCHKNRIQYEHDETPPYPLPSSTGFDDVEHLTQS